MLPQPVSTLGTPGKHRSRRLWGWRRKGRTTIRKRPLLALIMMALCVFFSVSGLFMQSMLSPRSQGQGGPVGRPYVIGVAGGSGAGKTTFVELLAELLKNSTSNLSSMDGRPHSVATISLDMYYRDLSHEPMEQRGLHNFDDPEQIDFETIFAHVQDMSRGIPIELPQYDFATHTRKPKSITQREADIVIFEGIFALHDERVRRLYDLTLFVDAPEELRLKRRLERDIVERGRSRESVLEQFYRDVKPMHDRHIEPCKDTADAVIDWVEWDRPKAVAVALRVLRELRELRESSPQPPFI